MLNAPVGSASPRATKLRALPLLVVALAAAPAPQPLYMPRNLKAAVAKGTRALDGLPGDFYWQNHAR